MLLINPVFEPHPGEGWVCDFGDEDGCSEPVRWVTESPSWVIPMFACDFHASEYGN